MKRINILMMVPLLLPLLVGCKPKTPIEFVPVSYYSDTLDPKMDSLNYSENNEDISFEINLMLLQENPKYPQLRRINLSILETAMGNDYFPLDTALTGRAAIDYYCSHMREVRAASQSMAYEAGGLSDMSLMEEEEMPWSISIKANPTLQTKKLLSYAVASEMYMGGAHGMHTVFYNHYDCATGVMLTIDSLFVWNKENHLAIEKLIYEGLQRMCETDTLGVFHMDDFTFTPDGTHMIDNYLINNESVTFYFNPYDIAPYSMGGISVEIPSYELYDYLRQDAPLYQFWFSK